MKQLVSPPAISRGGGLTNGSGTKRVQKRNARRSDLGGQPPTP